jgi:Uncharacterised protein family UPF0547
VSGQDDNLAQQLFPLTALRSSNNQDMGGVASAANGGKLCSGDMSEQAVELARAREALERGNLRRAVRRAWGAGIAAARHCDVEGLEAVIDLATAAGDQGSGRVKKDAQELAAFCTASLVNAHAGIRPPSPLAALFERPLEPTKVCPDCAEKVKKVASVCRFCGYRFDEH